MEKAKAGPVELTERIYSLDVLRGFAVLGILVMNIQDFSMISAAYFNPTAYGDLTGANWLVWLFSHLFADQKFMTLFSLLFGAGIILFTDRAESKGVRPAGIHYRRTLWLLVFGIIHGYCLWRGDILYAYGMSALLVYLFRRKSPSTLFILGLIGVSFCSLIYIFSGLSMPYWPPEQTAEMRDHMWMLTDEGIAKEIAAYSGSYADQMTHRLPSTLEMQTQVFFFYFLWRAGGLMLIGMALYKWGILSAKASTKTYLALILTGLGIGVPAILFGVKKLIANGWTFEYSFFLGLQFNYWGSLFIAAAYIGIIMLVVKLVRNINLLEPMAATGRMAFTNYLMQSVICTFIFYGHGLGLYGSIERTGQILIVICIWIFQVFVSWLWLKYFRFGPFEWLWRSLTYWKLQPMSKTA